MNSHLRLVPPDPLGLEDGFNFYRYAAASPVVHSDQLGPWSCLEFSAAAEGGGSEDADVNEIIRNQP